VLSLREIGVASQADFLEACPAALGDCPIKVVSVAEGMFCDFAKFRRLAFYGPTEFGASRWARHAV